jgi:hypothetical protein
MSFVSSIMGTALARHAAMVNWRDGVASAQGWNRGRLFLLLHPSSGRLSARSRRWRQLDPKRSFTGGAMPSLV